MRYISEVEFQRELARLYEALKEAKSNSEKQKIQSDIAYLKKQREESVRNEKLHIFNERR